MEETIKRKKYRKEREREVSHHGVSIRLNRVIPISALKLALRRLHWLVS